MLTQHIFMYSSSCQQSPTLSRRISAATLWIVLRFGHVVELDQEIDLEPRNVRLPLLEASLRPAVLVDASLQLYTSVLFSFTGRSLQISLPARYGRLGSRSTIEGEAIRRPMLEIGNRSKRSGGAMLRMSPECSTTRRATCQLGMVAVCAGCGALPACYYTHLK